jgi:hypothetical protein
MIGLLRHYVIHGAAIVSESLGRLSNTSSSLTFDFVADTELAVKMHHLQSVECFCDRILDYPSTREYLRRDGRASVSLHRHPSTSTDHRFLAARNDERPDAR